MDHNFAVVFTNSKKPVIYCTGCNKRLYHDAQIYLIGRNHWNCEKCFADYKQVMKDSNGIDIVVMKSNFVYESEGDPKYFNMDQKTSFIGGYCAVKAMVIKEEMSIAQIEKNFPNVNSEAFYQGMIDALKKDSFRYDIIAKEVL